MGRLGIITYSYPHLKTEQLLLGLISPMSNNTKDLKVYALPFKKRKEREILFLHRPNQANAVSPEVICKSYDIEYKECCSDLDIDDSCDEYLIAGAGILSASAVEHKKIINCHPGIIPIARGLDAFKWSIYNMQPIGNTLHYINENVDDGEIIAVLPTPVFTTDSLETFARRHYENEIKMLSSFQYYINHPQNDYIGIEIQEATMRMPFDVEVKMLDMFESYKERYTKKRNCKENDQNIYSGRDCPKTRSESLT